MMRPWFASVLWLLALAKFAAAQDWPQFLGPQRNGSYLGTNIAKSWPAEGPPLRWQRKIGAGFSGPVVVVGKMILFHRIDDKETVECLDAEKGTSLWSSSYPTHYRDDFGFDEGPRATPAIADGHVYTYGAEGVVSCWNLADGKKLWTVDAKKEYGAAKGFFGISCSPLVEGDSVLLNIGGQGAGIVGFDKATGKQRWKATDQEASYSSPAVADVHGKRYAFFLTHAGVVILSPGSGDVAAEFPWRPPIHASVSAATPLIVEDYVFLSTSYDRGAVLLQFDGKKLKQIWSGDDQLSNHYATSVYHDGHLYGFHGRQEQGCDLRCTELKTGKVKWSQDQFGAGTVTIVNDELFVLSEKGELIRAPAAPTAFKPSARAQILSFQVRAYPAIANGRLYARSKDRLVCVDLR